MKSWVKSVRANRITQSKAGVRALPQNAVNELDNEEGNVERLVQPNHTTHFIPRSHRTDIRIECLNCN